MFAQFYKQLKDLFSGQTSFPIDFPIRSTYGSGSIVVTPGLTVKEVGNGAIQQTVLTLDDVEIPIIDADTLGAHGSIPIYTLSNNITLVVATATLTVTKVGAGIENNAALIWAVGTAVVGTGDAQLTNNEANIITSTAATLSGGTNGPTNGASATPGIRTGSPVVANLNVAIPAVGASANALVRFTGTITLTWTNNVA